MFLLTLDSNRNTCSSWALRLLAIGQNPLPWGSRQLILKILGLLSLHNSESRFLIINRMYYTRSSRFGSLGSPDQHGGHAGSDCGSRHNEHTVFTRGPWTGQLSS